MKVTGGFLKNQNIISLNGHQVRPTSSKIRQAIFNILFSLDFDVSNTSLLDLFSGSGVISFEFISRGVANATLIDISKSALDLSKKNAINLKILNNFEFIKSDALSFVKNCNNLSLYNIIYIDPPYKYENYKDLVKLLLIKKNKQSLLIVESTKPDYIDEEISKSIIKQKKYDATFLIFYK